MVTDVHVSKYHFIWNGKGDKIKRNIVNDYLDGGLRMLDVAFFNKALKNYLDKKNTWTSKIRINEKCFGIMNFKMEGMSSLLLVTYTKRT